MLLLNRKIFHGFILMFLILNIFLLSQSAVKAQEKYPDLSRSIDLIIPFETAGVSDIAGRIFGDELSKVLGVPVIPLNKPGASGTVGATLVFKAPKDGYTLLVNTISGMVLAPVIFPKIEYETLKDFFPMAIISSAPSALVVKADSVHKNINELIDAARKNPGKTSYATAGVGSSGHFNGEILAAATNVKLKHIPFKSGGELVSAVMGGHVDFGMSAVITFAQLEKAGQVKALAITGKSRMKALPNSPTFTELGIKGDFFDNWTGFFVNSKIPKPILDKLTAATEKVIKSKEFIDRIEKAEGVVRFDTPSEFRKVIENNLQTAIEISKKVGMVKPK